MQIQLLRNATLVVQVGGQCLLIDPMLGPPASLPSFAFFRYPPRRNPLVPLPTIASEVLARVTAGLVTHCRWGHVDHLDRAGARWFATSGVPVYCQDPDAVFLRRRGMHAVPLAVGRSYSWAGGRLTAIPARHGYGLIGQLMGPGVGYLIESRGEPTLYISGDTVLSATVREVLQWVRPDVIVIAAGGASLDLGPPILMPLHEVLACIKLAPGLVIATHMEALNHCPITRVQLAAAVAAAGLAYKVRILQDGEHITI
jgi:L-ascorbate metabolism protein UlaG (beta-lactamase superfamily)